MAALRARVADLTLRGYEEDFGAFVRFLADHRGGLVSVADLAGLGLADFRAWLAWRHGEGYARSSTARAMSAVRGFFRYADRRHGLHNPALTTIGRRASHTACRDRWPRPMPAS